MLRSKLLFALLACSALLLPAPSQAQSHFTQCLDGAGNVFYATVVVPLESAPNIDGTPLPAGSEIAVFSADPAYPDLCAGVLRWQGAHAYLSVWGDDDLTPARDGLLDGEDLLYRVWDSASGIEYPSEAVHVAYAIGNGRYADDAMMVLDGLTVSVAPIAPRLVEPFDGAEGLSIHPLLAWAPVAGAQRYRVQLALSSDTLFSAPLVDSTLAAPRLEVVDDTLVNVTEYRWRVRMHSLAGASPWSGASVFETAALNLTLKKVFLDRRGVKVAKLKWSVEEIPVGKVDIYLDSLFVKRTVNDGVAKQKILQAGDGPFGVYVCQKKRVDVCSNTVVADFTEAVVDLAEEEESEEEDGVSYDVESGASAALVAGVSSEVPAETGLYANYPNPFNPVTTIPYALQERASVRLEVYNALGQRIADLVHEEQQPGVYEVAFDASRLPSGLYLYRLTAGRFTDQKTMLLVK